MEGFYFSNRSRVNLKGVHPELVRVVHHALFISPIDFSVIEGVRTIERQKELKNKGYSKTLNSRHLTGHAVDLAPIYEGTIPWDRWDLFAVIADAMKESARSIHMPLVWGGDWKNFKDGVHFEIPR